ncbi:hypothetical protein EYC80_003893 [Monilinia laxa]|uniref:Uncharacterized protein n=1 Tax=Monilinia laxa TaxID=61186 RepID=A0A5N6KLE0_MONLA|nr:hypothetical protein EYC80_003893 [Monilinia laxa]
MKHMAYANPLAISYAVCRNGKIKQNTKVAAPRTPKVMMWLGTNIQDMVCTRRCDVVLDDRSIIETSRDVEGLM